MRGLGPGLAIALAACSPPVRRDPPPPLSPAGRPEVPADAPEASQEERLAAIQKAMNELDEAARGCWAAVAVERFDLAGELAAMIDIGPAGMEAKVSWVRDTAGSPKLAACMAAVLAKYPWAPPLRGQAIQLPFAFRAPGGQNVIDRRLVPWVGQGKVSVATLLDENNTGNGAASLVEVALAAGGSTGMRYAERAELWYFLGPATVRSGATSKAVAEGDMMFVPRDGVREVIAGGAGVHAVIAIVPGGREGTARAGALPTYEAMDGKRPTAAPTFLPAASAKAYPRGGGQVRIYAEPATTRSPSLAASVLELPAGAAIPEHVHAVETEVLYVLAGAGTMKVGGIDLAVTPTSVVQVPANVPHAVATTAPLRAVQIYTPAGPEQRFKTP
ncbi:MAG: cupin domain-containing protein [Deltaproteobacteria bacterium]|nr:cupin domain-containing protein [Deltaproteobacteria bacterium]